MADVRVAVFIDGGNFHHIALKKIRTSEDQYDFDTFVNFLAGSRKIVRKGYYTGTVRQIPGDAKNAGVIARQTSFLTRLWKTKWWVETSKLRRRDETLIIDDRVDNYKAIRGYGFKEIKYTRDREKGVDVKIAVDILMGAVKDEYDVAIVISSDRDLLPAIQCVRGVFKKQIEYVGFSIKDSHAPSDPKKATNPTIALVKNSDTARVLTNADISPFIIPTLLSPSNP